MLQKSLKWVYSVACLGICLLATGCCGPMGCGVGCGAPGDSCYDCDGSSYGARPIPYGPIDALRNMKRSLVCGGGCGEVYYGEWMSTPPDACDPCDRDQWIGGATKCNPFCWEPGSLLGGLYGGRFCSPEDFAACECGGGGCDMCYGGDIMIDDGYGVQGGYDAGCGCATCDTRSMVGANQSTRIAQQTMPVQQRMSAEQRQRQMLANQQMQRTAQRMQQPIQGQSRTASRTITSEAPRSLYR